MISVCITLIVVTIILIPIAMIIAMIAILIILVYVVRIRWLPIVRLIIYRSIIEYVIVAFSNRSEFIIYDIDAIPSMVSKHEKRFTFSLLITIFIEDKNKLISIVMS